MNKQINIPESEMGMSGYSKFSWKLWEDGICNMLGAQRADQIMRKMGYRKSIDVAREIFEEIEQAQKEIVNRMQEFIGEWKQYSESTVDYFGGKYEAMEIALRLVKSILTDKNDELKKKYESKEANDETLD